jgi:hypothetical protein
MAWTLAVGLIRWVLYLRLCRRALDKRGPDGVRAIVDAARRYLAPNQPEPPTSHVAGATQPIDPAAPQP